MTRNTTILTFLAVALAGAPAVAQQYGYQPQLAMPMMSQPQLPAASFVQPQQGIQLAGCTTDGCAVDGDAIGGCDGNCGDINCAGGCGGCPDPCDRCGKKCGGACRGPLAQWLHNKKNKHGGTYYRPVRMWADIEYILWWNKERDIPALATTSPDGTLQDEAGVLGLPTTSVLFGGGPINNTTEKGYRVGVGWWLTPAQTIGIGARYFEFGEENVDFTASSEGTPILARPFFDTVSGQQTAALVAYPDLYSGSISSNNSNEVQGGDFYLRGLLYTGHGNRVDGLLGYQYAEILDSTSINHNVLFNDPDGRFPIGTRLDSTDSFQATNEFNGGSIGFMAESEDGCLIWRMMAKVGFGKMHQEVEVRGSSTVTAPNGDVSINDTEGLLAQPTNIGVFERDEFAVVPEASLSVGYKITELLQATVGYSVIYWSRAQMAGDAIDTTVNSSQLSGPLVGAARPQFTWDDTSYWLQGITFGVNMQY